MCLIHLFEHSHKYFSNPFYSRKIEKVLFLFFPSLLVSLEFKILLKSLRLPLNKDSSVIVFSKISSLNSCGFYL